MELEAILESLGVWLYEDVDTMGFMCDQNMEDEIKDYIELGYVVERFDENKYVQVLDGEKIVAIWEMIL